MRRALILFVFGMLLNGNAALGASDSDDFAYYAELSAASQQLQHVRLPLEVLLVLTRTDLGDIAVFDDQGNSLPHSIVKVGPEVTDLQLGLPFHEFDNFLRNRSTSVTRREQTEENGQLSELETTEIVPQLEKRQDYLIELESDGRHIVEIELDWTHEPSGQIVELLIEIGNELDRMRVLFRNKSLTNLNRDNAQWRTIGPLPRGEKYLRLTPSNSLVQFELNRVIGHYQQTLPAPTLLHRIHTTRIEEDGQVYYQFDIPSALAPEALRIIPPEAHSVIRGDLFASSDYFSKHRQAVAMNVQQHNIVDAEVRASDPLRLDLGAYPTLRFSSRDALPSPPVVELIYPVYELVFLGNGVNAYRLAWGNYASAENGEELRQILNNSLDDTAQRGEEVFLSATMEGGGVARLQPRAVLPWQKWLLWVLLALAVLVTARMALRLYRDMRKGDSPASS